MHYEAFSFVLSNIVKMVLNFTHSELGGWISPVDDNRISCGFFRSPVRDLEDLRNDQTVYVLLNLSYSVPS